VRRGKPRFGRGLTLAGASPYLRRAFPRQPATYATGLRLSSQDHSVWTLSYCPEAIAGVGETLGVATMTSASGHHITWISFPRAASFGVGSGRTVDFLSPLFAATVRAAFFPTCLTVKCELRAAGVTGGALTTFLHR
jgi:hypothetical protein